MNKLLDYPFWKTVDQDFKKFLDDKNAKMHFDSSDNPVISIVLLTYNKVNLTFGSLKSLKEQLRTPYELIIVDNASTDNTKELLSRVTGAKVILNSTNLYYAKGIHVGAEKAKGQYLLLLNNDIQVFPGFDQALLKVFKDYPTAGAVGGQLILPDGSLQEAGCMVNSNGVPWGYGRGDDPSHWQYRFVREVDYCSAAVLLVDRELFWRVGGFELAYEPAYFEDTDLAMKIRESGRKVFYTPYARSYHHEHGTSNKLWVVRQLEKNRRLFLKRWKKVLTSSHVSRRENKYRARERGSKFKILMIDSRVPVSANGGGYPRALKIVGDIKKLGYDLTFFPIKKDEVDVASWSKTSKELRESGVEVVDGDIKFSDFLRERSGQFDLVWVSRFSVMEKAFFLLKGLLPEIPIIYDSEAVNFERLKQLADFQGTKTDEAELKRLQDDEVTFFELCEQSVFVSRRELEIVEKIIPSIPQSAEILGYSPPVLKDVPGPNGRSGIYFVGGFLGSFGLNEHAIQYFLKNVFPEVHKVSGEKFFIVGANIPESIRGQSGNGVQIAGFVENVEDVYRKARFMVMPHQFSGGISLKLLEALSFGVPCVISTHLAEQMSLQQHQGVLVSSSPSEFVSNCNQLAKDDVLWKMLSAAAQAYMSDTHSEMVWQETLAKMLSKMENVE